MSNTNVDRRVVEMQFNNRQFENGVQTSLSTLDKLKAALKFDGAVKGFDEISKAAENVRIPVLSSAVETVSNKFSALEVMAVTALANITNSAVNAGKQIVNALAIEPISQGYSEYELKMNSVQTIMASTGEDLDTVMKKLNELNTYADKTIYSFSDMTSNIGKFTNAGVDLDTAVAAIQGVSNVAAVSGANAENASHAMYNFAQALSSGYVKLIDWKSIEVANMATVDFKQNLMDTAVEMGTLVKVGDKYQSTTTDMKGSVSAAFDATHNFNEALSSQWMTTDVLTKTLAMYSDETTDIGKKAMAAAQDVKTFTQLMDTLKEAVGSGWAETWEHVFGDFEEAKSLWTDVSNVMGGIIGAQADARNTMLNGWESLGGRDSLIKSLWNSFYALVDVIDLVKEAFHNVFPPVTTGNLMALTKGLEALTEKFKMTFKTSYTLKTLLTGFFSVLNIIKNTVAAVVKGFSPLLDGLKNIYDRTAGVWLGLGDFLTGIDRSAEKLDIYSRITEGISSALTYLGSVPEKLNDIFKDITGISIGDAFDKIHQKITDALAKVKEAVDGFGSADVSGLQIFSDKISERLKPVSSLFDGVKKLFGGIWEFFQKLAPLFSTVITTIGNVLGTIGTALMDAFGNADFNKLFDIFNSGVLAAIGVGIMKFVSSVSAIPDNIGGIFDNIKDILDGVRGCLESYQQNIRAKTLMTIAGAVGILTASIVALSMVDSQKLSEVLLVMAGEFAELMGSMKIFTTIIDGVDMKSMSAMGSVMISLSAALLIMSIACAKMAELEWEELIKGLTGMAGLIAGLLISAKVLSECSGDITKSSVGLIAFAVALRLLVEPVKELGSLDLPSLGKGLLGIGILCTELALFLKNTDFDGLSMSKGVGIIILAGAVKILASAVGEFAGMDTAGMIQGLIAVAAVLAELAAFTKLTGDSKNIIATSTGLVILGAAMHIFAGAIEKMGSLSIETLAKGLGAMAIALAEIAAAIHFMPSDTAVIGVGMVLMGAALKIIAGALEKFGSLSLAEIGKGLLAMAGVLVELAVAANAMTAALPGAAAILVISGALAMLAPVLKIFGSMSLEEIGKSLLMLAGTFTVLGLASLVLAPITPAMLALSGAVALFGVGALACGAGILALSSGLSALAVSGVLGINALIDIFKAIGEAAPELIDTVVTVLSSALEAIKVIAPQLANTVLVILDEVLATLAEHGPNILQSLLTLVLDAVQVVSDNIGKVVDVVIDVILNLISAIAAKIPDICQAGIDIVVGLIDGLAEGIRENSAKLRDCFINLFQAVVDGICTFLGIHSPSTVFDEIGGNVIAGFIQGVGKKIGSALKQFTDFLSDILKKFRDKYKEFSEQGMAVIKNFVNGIKSKLSSAKEAVSDFISAVREGFDEKIGEFKEIGINLIEGLKNGIASMKQKVVDSVSNIGDSVISGLKDLLGIHSPSTVAEEIGKFFDEGLANGLTDSVKEIKNAVGNIAAEALSTLTEKADGFQSGGEMLMEKFGSGMKNSNGAIKDSLNFVKNTFGRMGKETALAFGDGYVNASVYPTRILTSEQNKMLNSAKASFDVLLDNYKKGFLSASEYSEKVNKLLKNNTAVRCELETYAAEQHNAALDKEISAAKTAYDNEISEAKKTYDAILDNYKNGIITREEYDKQYTEAVKKYSNVRIDLVKYSQDKMTEYISDSLKTVNEKYEDRLSEIQDKIDSFSDRIRMDYSDAFEFTTNKDIFDDTVSGYTDKINELNTKLEKTKERYGENSSQAKSYQSQIDKLTASMEEYKKSYKESGVEDDDIVAVNFTGMLEKKTAEIKKYNHSLSELVSKDIDDDMIAMISEMEQKKGMATVDYLNSLSDEELRTVKDNWAEYKEETQKLGQTLYGNDIREATDKYVNDVADITNALPESAKTIGGETVMGLADGYSESTEKALAVIGSSTDSIVDRIREKFKFSFASIPTGEEMSKSLSEGLKKGFVNSELFGKIGKLSTKLNDIFTKNISVKNEPPAVLLEMLKKCASLIDKAPEYELTVKPVLDMSEIEKQEMTAEKRYLSAKLIDTNIKVDMADSNTYQILSKVEAAVNAANSVLKDTRDLMVSLRADINSGFSDMGENFGDMGVVLDTGVLVGQLTKPLNKSLGMLTAFKGRNG